MMIDNKEKAIFLPHCLRHKDCPARMKEDGLACINCGKCGIGPFRKDALDAGYNIYICPGGSMVKSIIENNGFKEVIGVACGFELKEAHGFLKGKKLKVKSVQLSKDGCVNTEVDWDKVRKVCGLD